MFRPGKLYEVEAGWTPWSHAPAEPASNLDQSSTYELYAAGGPKVPNLQTVAADRSGVHPDNRFRGALFRFARESKPDSVKKGFNDAKNGMGGIRLLSRNGDVAPGCESTDSAIEAGCSGTGDDPRSGAASAGTDAGRPTQLEGASSSSPGENITSPTAAMAETASNSIPNAAVWGLTFMPFSTLGVNRCVRHEVPVAGG